MAVELHYRAIQGNPVTGVVEPHHTRAMHADVDSAIAQAAEDLSQGMDPIGVFERKGDGARNDELWDGTPTGKTYEPKDWKPILSRDDLHRQAKAVLKERETR